MTLIVAAISPSAVVVGADLRISRNGQLINDESTKLTVLITSERQRPVGQLLRLEHAAAPRDEVDPLAVDDEAAAKLGRRHGIAPPEAQQAAVHDGGGADGEVAVQYFSIAQRCQHLSFRLGALMG